MKKGIQTHTWGYYKSLDQTLIATCIADTLFEAESYFEDVDLEEDPMYYIEIIQPLNTKER
jgi:hypothetical protein